MTLYEPEDEPDFDPEDTPADAIARQRAFWALGGLVLVGVIISVLIFVITDFTSSKGAGPVTVAGSSFSSGAAVTYATVTPAPSPSPSPAATPLVTPSVGPVGTASCPTAAACAIDGDAGDAQSALSALRSSHQLGDVSVTSTPQAQACALAQGDGPTCPTSYFWEPLSALDGNALVAKIIKNAKGSAFLLDPAATAFTVGWSYTPGANGKPGAVSAVIAKGS